jgi:hypothetical protein
MKCRGGGEVKTMISRVFSKREKRQPLLQDGNAPSSELSSSDIESYYLRIIADCLRRMLVPADSVEIELRRTAGSTGLPSFVAYVRVLRWDPVVTPVLLQNMPVIDARIRKLVDASVILEHTEYTGLWFQASSSIEGSPKALLGLPLEVVHRSAERAPS